MKTLAGTGPLLRLALRRDRVVIASTLAFLFAMTAGSVRATVDLYPDAASRRTAALAAESMPAMVALYGHIHDLDGVGGVGLAKLVIIDALTLVALVVMVMRRHTRQEEESGRLELLGSQVMGRRAPLASATILSLATSLVAGALAAAAAVAGGLPTLDGCVFGAGLAGLGLAWTGVMAVLVQLVESNRTTGALGWGAFGLCFVLRAVGDVTAGHATGFLVWASPLGWEQQMRPGPDHRWWPLALSVALLVVGLAIGDALLHRRDLGTGLFGARPGPAQGTLHGPLALTWRLERSGIWLWTLSFAALGAMSGAVLDDLGGFMPPEASDMLRKMGGSGDLQGLYVGVIALFGGLMAACMGLTCALGLRREETAGHLEAVLSTGASRLDVLRARTVIAVLGSCAAGAAMALALAVAHALASGQWDRFAGDLGALLVPLPAVFVCVALALALVGTLPRQSWLAWLTLGLFALLGELGAMLHLPPWTMKLSPFAWLPKVPAEPMRWAPVAGVTVVAVLLLVAAGWGFRRRDLPVG